jgi:hypothetical protein
MKFLLVLIAALCCAGFVLSTPLDDYIALPDPTFGMFSFFWSSCACACRRC